MQGKARTVAPKVPSGKHWQFGNYEVWEVPAEETQGLSLNSNPQIVKPRV